MPEEFQEAIAKAKDAVKVLEDVDSSNKDIYEDVAILVDDITQALFAEDEATKAAEKKDAINSIVAILTKVNAL